MRREESGMRNEEVVKRLKNVIIGLEMSLSG